MAYNQHFLKCCEQNNLEGVTYYLSCGADVNTVSDDGCCSGLTIAAKKNYPELLEILLSHPQIKINNTTRDVDNHQWTALMFACDAGNSAIVSRLVQVPGLDINHQDEDGDTAARWASDSGHTECVSILAETDRVDWNKRNKGGRTPLYLALEQGHSDIVDIIVQQPNIDYNVKTKFGETLGQAAVSGGNEKCLETVLRCPRVDLNCRDEEGWSLVFRAIQRKKLGEKILKFSVE